MALTMFTRFVSVQNVMNINTVNVLCTTIKEAHRLNAVSRSYTSTINADQTNIEDSIGISLKSNKRVSRQMRAYIERVQKHEEFMKKEIVEYEIGVRHLANMMGRDPQEMSVNRINKSIRYLFPSGLFERRAVPRMAHPSVVHPPTKDAAFDENGRPYHFMFYTGKPNYYEALHNLTVESLKLNTNLEKAIQSGRPITEENKMNPIGSKWIGKKKMKKMFSETLSNDDYEYFISCLERLLNNPMSADASDLIMKYRDEMIKHSSLIKIPELCDGEDGRKYIVVPDCMRRSARGEVIIRNMGSGRITINGKNITYFEDIHCREQVIFPLIFTGMADKVDVEATVRYGGPAGQAGAIRWGIAWGLRSFVDEDMVEKMRLAGLLTRDWRRRERKKWGQEGARRKFTWNKR